MPVAQGDSYWDYSRQPWGYYRVSFGPDKRVTGVRDLHTEANFRNHILGGLRTAARAVTADCGAPRQAPPAASDFEVRAIDDDTKSPMELAVAKDGRVFYVERITGEVKVIKPDGTVLTAGVIPVSSVQENGTLMGTVPLQS